MMWAVIDLALLAAAIAEGLKTIAMVCNTTAAQRGVQYGSFTYPSFFLYPGSHAYAAPLSE
jgi:hypothetical protein